VLLTAVEGARFLCGRLRATIFHSRHARREAAFDALSLPEAIATLIG
jgi:hypothetical protein